MSKKTVLKKFMLTGALISGGIFSLAVVSCELKKTGTITPEDPTIESKDPESPTTSGEKPSTGTDGKKPNSNKPRREQPTINFSEVLEKVNVKITNGNPEQLSVYDISEGVLKFSEYDEDQFKLAIKKIVRDNEKQEVRVSFFLIDFNFDEESKIREVVFSGFKKINEKEMSLAQEANKINIDYPKKQEVLIKDVDASKITFNGYDPNKFSVEVTKLDNDSETEKTDFINVKVKITDIKSNLDISITRTISGFKSEFMLEVEKKIKKTFKDFTIFIKDKTNREVSSIKIEDIETSGFNENEVDARIEKIVPNDKSFSMNIVVVVFVKKAPEIVKRQTYSVKNFKDTGISQAEFDEASKKITLDYKDRSFKFVIRATSFEDIVMTGLDKNRMKIEYLDLIPDIEASSLKVTFLLKDLNTNNKSKVYMYTIERFKSNTEALAINKENTEIARKFLFDVSNKSINLRNVNVNEIPIKATGNIGYKVLIKKREVFNTGRSLKISFTVFNESESNKIESDVIEYTISGFAFS